MKLAFLNNFSLCMNRESWFKIRKCPYLVLMMHDST
jgi:hypothetical protein